MRSLLLAIAAVWPVQGLALSCLPWTETDAYAQARDSAAGYVVGHGTLAFDASALPKPNSLNQADTVPVTQIPAMFRGKTLTDEGFTRPFETQVTLSVQCAAAWCAGVRPGPVLAFMRQTDTGYLAEARLCSTLVLSQPDAAVLQRVVTCHTGGDCPSSQP